MDLQGSIESEENIGDIILKVEDSEIKCSKQELINKSEYFQAMFKFKEKREKFIELHSVEASAVKILVDWVNTNNIECVNNMNEDELFDLLQASNMLQFVTVQEACVVSLTAMLNFQNCFRIKKQADFLSEKRLFNAANAFCLWNFKKVVSSEAFVKLELDDVKTYLRNLQINVEREACIVDAVFTWILYEVERTEFLLTLIVETVIFPKLSIAECQLLCKSDLVQNCGNVRVLFECIISIKNGEKSVIDEDEVDTKDNPSKLQTARKLLENDSIRHLPTQPCVVGHRLEPPVPGNLPTMPCQRHNIKRVACVLMYNRRTGEVEEVVDMAERVKAGWKPFHDGEGPGEANGYKVIDLDGGFIVLGGEFDLGKSNWNSSVLKYCSMEDAWTSLTPLENSRRHHSLVRIESKIYLIGGYGKHRKILNTVEVLDTVSGKVTQCDNLPVPLHHAAATHWRGRIYVFGQFMVCYLEPGVTDTWKKVENFEMPRLEFSTALSSKTHIYLTSTHCHELYRFNPDPTKLSPDQLSTDCKDKFEPMELMGKFSKETHNTTIVDNVIYNFNTEDFDDERVVECFDIQQSKFSVLWKKDCPKMDFSPNYSLGCFPIVSYD